MYDVQKDTGITSYEFHANLKPPRPTKKQILSGMLIVGLTISGFFGPDLVSSEETCSDTDVTCHLEAAGLHTELPQDPVPTTILSEVTPAESTTTITLPPPPPETIPPTTAPAPPPEVKPPEAAVGKEHRTPVSPETAAAIEAMNLTVEGYQNFFNTIDYSLFDYAQGYSNFNPSKVPIAQNKTEFVTAHYTDKYSNFEGMSEEAIGEMDVKGLIDYLGNKGNPCCAVNFIITRHALVFQTAPFNAKLRHNPPFDSQTVGFEIEATDQPSDTALYEAASYLTIATLFQEQLLGKQPMAELFRGHGHMRDEYREAHPEDKRWDPRDDFDEGVMALLLPKLEAFVQNTPNLAELSQPLR